jgi:hypothetical protein
MLDIATVGLDLAENVFQVHRFDGAGRAVLQKKLQQMQDLGFSPSHSDTMSALML